MPYTTATPLKGTGRGDPDRITAWALSRGALRPDDVASYVGTVYRLAPQLGLNPDVVIAQSIHETAVNGVPWASYWWEARCNPAGIGITGDPEQNARSRRFQDGEEAARAHLLHLSLYVNGAGVPDGFSAREDPRWDAALAAGYAGIATTLADLTNRWGIDDGYAAKVARWLNSLEAAELLVADTPEDPMAGKLRDKPIVLAVGMGHRNTRKGGASGEYDWTPGAARALQRRAKARGIKAYLIQEYDGDNDPNFAIGRDVGPAAAAGLAGITKTHGTIDAVVFMHYNGGAGGGAHFLHTDGWVSTETKTANMSDLRMVRAIAAAVGKTGTVSLMRPTWAGISDPQPGVMSERQSGAVNNRRNYRLAEMVAAAAYRDTIRRVVAEAGSIDVARDRAFIRDPEWVEHVYCEAILDGIEVELGVYRPEISEPQPEPEPIPVYAKPVRLPELDALDGAPVVPAAVRTEREGWFAWIGRDVTVMVETPRNQLPAGESEPVGKVLLPGERFYAPWLNTSGPRPYYYTLWGTRIWADDTDLGVPNDGDVDFAA